jgi:trimeric autotransporter adhesin
MSELSLLILASVGAALAFFVAGLLLRRPRAGQNDQHTLALELDLQLARADQQRAVDALAESQRLYEAEASGRKSEQAARASIERERDIEKAEHIRLAAREKTLADRLRAAEEAGRTALEQVESNAAAWDARWQAAQIECKRQEQELKQELEKLRALRDAETKEHAKLAASVQKLTAEKADAQRAAAESSRALAVAQAQSKSELTEQAQALQAEAKRVSQKEAEIDARERESRASVEQSASAWRQRLERAESESQAKLASKEAEWHAKLAASESDWQARRSARESEWQAKLAARESELQAKLVAKEAAWLAKDAELRAQGDAAGAIKQSRAEIDRLSKELERLRADHQSEREQRQRLEIVARATEEALAAEQALAKSTAQAARGAEGRLREFDRLTEENAELRAECERLTEEAKLGAGREGEAKDVKVELAAAQAKLAELAQVLEENRKLRDEVAELLTHQEASGELERLTAAHKQLRLDAELMSRRLQELTHDQAELTPLRAQAAEASSLQQEVQYLRRREKDLEAQLYASGYFASREMPAVSGELLVQTPVTDMETSLDALLVDGGPRTAVLADGQGFLIAGAGESMAQEGLAAFAGVAGDLVARARMLLPLADVNSIRLTDANRMVLSCHLFDSDGQNLEIATLGPGEPPAEDTQRTIAGLAATLAGGDTDDKGTK